MKNIILTTVSNVPIYQQLYDQIVYQIFRGDLMANTPLLSIRTAAKELRVSIITVKKAWEDLERDGYIYTIAGKGSFVAELSSKLLEEKKTKLLKDALMDKLVYYKELGVTKEMINELIGHLYKE